MIRVDLSSLGLDEMATGFTAAARPAAQAAAQEFYNEAKRNVVALGRKTGNLSKSIYQVYSEQNSEPGRATYHVSWNPRTAPHAHLLEWGHIQRYVSYVGSDGNFYTAVRPNMRGKPKPRRRASQAQKDAYYVTLPAPRQMPAYAFMRRAASAEPRAEAAALAELRKVIDDA